MCSNYVLGFFVGPWCQLSNIENKTAAVIDISVVCSVYTQKRRRRDASALKASYVIEHDSDGIVRKIHNLYALNENE